jgi:hypothetical protein
MTQSGNQPSLNSQELLSMNMDRLRGYMKKWASEEEQSKKPREKPTRKSQRLVAVKKGREVLVISHDPMRLIRIGSTNDNQALSARFRLSLSQSFASAVEKLLESNYSALVIDDDRAEQARGVQISGLDFLLILKGTMSRDDQTFLVRKQAFLKEMIPGDNNSEKLVNFRLVKSDCKELPFLYLTSDINSREAALASVVHNVKSVDCHTNEFTTLFVKLADTFRGASGTGPGPRFARSSSR